MKKFILLVNLFALLTITAFAQNSNMVFFTEKGEKFLLFLNGNQQNQMPQSNVKIQQMPASIYQIRVVFEDKTNGEINDKVSVNPNTEKTWKIRLKDIDTRTKLNSGLNTVGLPSATNTETKYVIRALSEIPLVTNSYNTNPTNNQEVINYQPGGYNYNMNTGIPNNGQVGTNVAISTDPNGNVNMNVGVNGVNTNVNSSTTGVQTQTTTTSTNTSTNNGGFQQQYSNQNTGHVGCAGSMPLNLFNIEKNKVRMQKTEAGKLIICKKIVNTKCLTSQQTYELISFLVMSKNRMEVAKLAYPRSFDPDNFEVVFNAFSISAQVEELNAYIQQVNASWGVTTTTTTTTNNTNNNQNNNWNNPNPNNTNPNNNSWNNNQNNNQNWVPGYSGPIGCPQPMSSISFEEAKQSIQSKSFENTKLDVAKQIVGQNCLTTDQVKSITKLFGFESTKLEFAKFAYSHTYDKGNYYKVNDAFQFESSIGELQEYIKGE